ncbi:pyridoxamine 5'-phosphate oxidase family protein [Pseudodonghicola flavimaris]|uniref:Pyridoxamine 5'-phosphate oxidase family protein n=1 Tax=Pseudodonghicola flavimaris TaxID=3050036 RepID=A0ABT7EV01_9RHOB|nr:pyridoxamine 5'-phosphate oxidase family protein [Pseudodonghicola flavimaris]MDK3016174.1 pyridoxamine 5'-phosphate oxidase family protein [Pseudodonghicola flavimaris]
MAKQFDRIEDDHRRFIEAQHLFFVGSAAAEGHVNISPKGMDSLRVLGPNRILWRNLTGSGNETAGHLRQVNRMTLMWCGFEKRPLILRAYGHARTLHPRDADFAALDARFAPSPGARQLYDMTVELVQTSCGYAVPFFDYAGERDVLAKWAETKGPAGIAAYWAERNQTTLDGMATGILGEPS